MWIVYEGPIKDPKIIAKFKEKDIKKLKFVKSRKLIEIN